MNEWQYVATDTYKLKVPGGWLYRYTAYTGVAMQFVPNLPPVNQ